MLSKNKNNSSKKMLIAEIMPLKHDWLLISHATYFCFGLNYFVAKQMFIRVPQHQPFSFNHKFYLPIGSNSRSRVACSKTYRARFVPFIQICQSYLRPLADLQQPRYHSVRIFMLRHICFNTLLCLHLAIQPWFSPQESKTVLIFFAYLNSLSCNNIIPTARSFCWSNLEIRLLASNAVS